MNGVWQFSWISDHLQQLSFQGLKDLKRISINTDQPKDAGYLSHYADEIDVGDVVTTRARGFSSPTIDAQNTYLVGEIKKDDLLGKMLKMYKIEHEPTFLTLDNPEGLVYVKQGELDIQA